MSAIAVGDLLAKGTIRFEIRAFHPRSGFCRLLDHLIETALRCPTINIEIAGHTDADGPEGFNKAMSEKRAEVVTDYLVKAGLPAGRFTAVGYGSTQRLRRTRPTRASRITAASNSW